MGLQSFAERFWRKVNRLGPVMPGMRTCCWEWTASLDDSGYGKFGVGGGNWDRAHRVAWKLAGRRLRAGKCVLHKCDNRKCTRLSHLYEGTKRNNAQDRENRGRGNHAVGARHGCFTHPGLRSGERNGRAKLDEARVKQLLMDFFKHGKTKADLARKYKLTPTTVGYVVSGKLWPHVEGRV